MPHPEPRCIPWLEQLVSFDTTSRDSNLALIDHVRAYLDELGVPSTLTYDDDRRKANLFATINPRGVDRPGVVLSGHTDVVPVDGQQWSTDPFRLTRVGDRYHGRGSADMKGFIACCLEYVPDIVAAELPVPVHLALTYDEEVGCIGVHRLIHDVTEAGITARGCIVGEPTELLPVRAHKGKVNMHCTVRGKESHSALADRGVNAVEVAAELVARLRAIAARFREQGPHDQEFDPPYTTVHTGTIRGGTALNIVPARCEFDFEVRHLPGDDPEAVVSELQRFANEELLPGMVAVDPSAGFDWDRRPCFPPLDTAEDDPVVQLARTVSGTNGTGKVSFGTEGGLFQAAGFPTIVCGPGSIGEAHKPDEFVAASELLRCERMLERLIEHLAQPS